MTQHLNQDASLEILERVKAYQEIKGRLREQLGHRWEPGVRLPPIKQLARELKIGQTNTHRAVRELAKEGLLVSRPGQGTFVTDKVHAQRHLGPWRGSQTEFPAQGTALKGKWVEILMTATEPDRFIRDMVEAFEATIGRYGARTSRNVFNYGRAEPFFGDDESDALVVINPNYQTFNLQPHQALMVISTAMEIRVPLAGCYDVVSVDSEQGGMLAADHLKTRGCKSVCFLGVRHRDNASNYDLTSSSRLTGFERVWGECLSPQRRLIVEAYMTKWGAKAVADYLQMNPRPEAVFAASDELAIGFVHGALAHGLEPGHDYQILGFDGQQCARELAGGPLTTVAVPGMEMGELGAALLTQRMLRPQQNVRRVLLGCTIEKGVTTTE